jgi:hypothetical protein
MSETPLLALPLIAAEQAQKHVTLNEALNALDALVQLAVKDRDVTAPPGSPAEGDRYIVAAGASGAWAGRDLDIAAWQGGAWNFYEPTEGWRCWIEMKVCSPYSTARRGTSSTAALETSRACALRRPAISRSRRRSMPATCSTA